MANFDVMLDLMMLSGFMIAFGFLALLGDKERDETIAKCLVYGGVYPWGGGLLYRIVFKLFPSINDK
jgi:hypothetical protein